MPRQAHGRSLQRPAASTGSKRKDGKGRGLDALQIAESENPEHIKIKQHRLGESYPDDDKPRSRADVDERSSKRRKVTQGEGAEASESGSDLDGERWHVGVAQDDEDSDLDSDEAFGESDEERFADFTFRGSKRNVNKGHTEEEEEAIGVDNGSEDDDLGDEAVDLATALDMNEQSDGQGFPAKRKRGRNDSPASESQLLDEDEKSEQTENSEEEEEQDSDLSVSDQEDGDLDRLQSFVQSLKTKKLTSENSSAPKAHTAASKISAADLLPYVKDPRQRQSLKILQNNEVKGPEPYKGGVPGRLAPPLAKRQQDRLDRVAAYDESKKELGKWVETVKQNRRADHLSFPLVDPESVAALNNSQMAPVSQLQPMSSLESKIQEIMAESGLSGKGSRSAEQEEQEFEELQEKKMPLAEVQARRAALRQARDLMFREEIRAKRIKKIKSKAYRRIHRKERDRANIREQAELAENGIIDSDEEREKTDRRRAEERMGARHRESKWAKAVKAAGRAAWDEDVRGGVADLARRDEELRRRVEGKPGKGSDLDSESESDGYDSDADDQEFENRLAAVDRADSDAPTSKLESMAFMKRAEAARNAANDTEIQEIRNELRDDRLKDQLGDSESELEPAPGRQIFTGKGGVERTQPAMEVANRNEFEEWLSEDEDRELLLQDNVAPVSAVNGPTLEMSRTEHSKSVSHEQNPQAKRPPHGGKAASTQQLRETRKSQYPRALLAPSEAQNMVLEAPNSPTVSEPSNHDPITPNPNEPSTINEAIFFGDEDVLPAFEVEKKQVIAEEDDQLLDDPNALPGWGSWTGTGISKKAQARSLGNFKKRSNAKAAVIKGVKPQDRQDAKLDRVIVNEKLVKKNQKYLATELPHPFETRAQYERSLRVPIGPEWTTKATFQDAVKPRILVKQGIMRAVRKPLA